MLAEGCDERGCISDVTVAALYHEEWDGEVEPQFARVQRIFDRGKLLSCESTARDPVSHITVRR